MSLGQHICSISTHWVNHTRQISSCLTADGVAVPHFPIVNLWLYTLKHARWRRQTLHFAVGFLRAWPLPSTQTQYVIVHKLITAAYSLSYHSWLYVVFSDESILRENKFQTWNCIFSVIVFFVIPVGCIKCRAKHHVRPSVVRPIGPIIYMSG